MFIKTSDRGSGRRGFQLFQIFGEELGDLLEPGDVVGVNFHQCFVGFEAGAAAFVGSAAGGFFAFSFSRLPPMRQFGTLAGLGFLLSMLADFTALPAALWLIGRHKPDAGNPAPAAE